MSHDLAPRARRSLAIGTFDGVHLGHRGVIEAAICSADARGLRSAVITFHPHPIAVIRPELAPPELATLARRIQLASEIAPDEVIVVPFTEALSHLDADRFAREVLSRRLGAEAVTVGLNFRYGHRAAGTTDRLAASGSELGFDVTVMPLLAIDGEPVSSSRIRELIGSGDVVGAERLLGRPPWLDGEIVHGDKRGREIGFPTANVLSAPRSVIPARGIYAGRAHLPDGSYTAAISVGYNPTFTDDRIALRVEAYLLDFDADVYGAPIQLEFVHRLRDEARFDGVDALVEQLARDVEQTRSLLG
jgi:riboflavin kinase/FMN adenylyltransferase